jgi:hypothetical protein
MRTSSRIRWAVAIVCVAAGIASGSSQSPENPKASPKATIGEPVPDFEFREFLAGGDGRRKLSDLRGQPVLLVNWTDTEFGRGAAREAKAVDQELSPEGLIVILLDTHNMKPIDAEAGVLRLFPGSTAWLAPNQKLPIAYLDNGPPPDIALIGVDGKLLVAGSYTADLNKAAQLAKEELKRMQAGWGEHAAAKTARASAFGQRRLADAQSALAAALMAEPGSAELLEVEQEIAARRASWEASARYLLEHGQPLRALEAAEALAESSQGSAEWEPSAASLLKEFEDASVAREIELDRQLTKLLKPLTRKAPKPADAAKLREFAEGDAAGTRVGKRALHLADVTAAAARD